MTTARFRAAGWIPAALIHALDTIDAATFTPNVAPTTRNEEIRAALRQARDALRDADAAYAANVEALNHALGLKG